MAVQEKLAAIEDIMEAMKMNKVPLARQILTVFHYTSVMCLIRFYCASSH
jgi:hypothetical protein